MAEVLSQAQIDALLGSLQSGDSDLNEVETTSGSKVKDYDFTSPKRFTREQLKIISNIYDSFTRLFSLHLASMLRIPCEMEVVEVEEEKYREFNNALDDSVLIGLYNVDTGPIRIGDDDKVVMLEVNRQISFSIIDRLLGGNGSGYAIDRDYTDIELSLLEYLLKQVSSLMQNAWSNFVEVDHHFGTIETNSRLVQIIQQDEAVAIVVIKVTIGELEGNINVCMPGNTLDAIFKFFDLKYAKGKKSNSEQDQIRKDSITDGLKDSNLDISAVLGTSQISLHELLSLQPGDVIPLNSAVVGNNIVVNVKGIPWYKGSVGIKKKHYAVKLSDIL
ncbi:MAG: flagellar motor switch protein FliM [Clostridiales bacterium]|nr:flagellar motor switch protein FliM [Clostridiales bacterium]